MMTPPIEHQDEPRRRRRLESSSAHDDQDSSWADIVGASSAWDQPQDDARARPMSPDEEPGTLTRAPGPGIGSADAGAARVRRRADSQPWPDAHDGPGSGTRAQGADGGAHPLTPNNDFSPGVQRPAPVGPGGTGGATPWWSAGRSGPGPAGDYALFTGSPASAPVQSAPSAQAAPSVRRFRHWRAAKAHPDKDRVPPVDCGPAAHPCRNP